MVPILLSQTAVNFIIPPSLKLTASFTPENCDGSWKMGRPWNHPKSQTEIPPEAEPPEAVESLLEGCPGKEVLGSHGDRINGVFNPQEKYSPIISS